MACNDTQEHPLKASVDRPSKIRKINLSLSQLESGGQDLCRIPGKTRGGSSLKYTRCLSRNVPSRPTEQDSVFIDEKAEAQRGTTTRQVSHKTDCRDSISGLLAQCSLGPGPITCPPSAMSKPYGLSEPWPCLLSPCDSLYV